MDKIFLFLYLTVYLAELVLVWQNYHVFVT